jgi:hypothetical protein
MNYCGAWFKMGLAFDVANRSFADQYAKKETLELKQQLSFDFAISAANTLLLWLHTVLLLGR